MPLLLHLCAYERTGIQTGIIAMEQIEKQESNALEKRKRSI